MNFFFVINVIAAMVFCGTLKLYGEDVIESGEKIQNIAQMRNIWNKLYKKDRNRGNPKANIEVKPFYYFIDTIIKNMTQKERHAVLKDAYSRPRIEPLDDDTFFLGKFIIYYVKEEKNEETVIEILSQKCPQTISLEPIESYIATLTEFEYPMRLLFTAYEKSKDDINRNIIVAALVSAFQNFDIKGKGQYIEPSTRPRPLSEAFMKEGNNELFMKNAKIWYEQNKDKIILDNRYSFGSPNLWPENEKIVKVYLFKYK